MVAPGEQIDPVTNELSDAHVDDQRVSVLYRGLHRLPLASDQLQVVMLGELHSQFAQVFWADSDVLKHFGIVGGHLAAAHGSAKVVASDADLIADHSWSRKINGHNVAH